MLLLTSTSDKLQLVTVGAADVDVHVSFMDYNGTTVTPGRTNTAITTATTTDILGSPGSSIQRNAKTLHVRNKDSADATTVTVVHTDGTTAVELFEATLNPGDHLEYIEGVGFYVVPATTVPEITGRSLSADQSNSTTTPTEVTGLTIPTGTGNYAFKYWIIYQSSATGTGVKFSVNHDGTVGAFVYNLGFLDVSNITATGAPGQTAGPALVSTYGARAKSTAGLTATLSVDAANSDMLALIEGAFTCSGAGNLELWHGSETAAATTTKAGSTVLLTKAP